MSVLTTQQRKNLPAQDFALGKGRYPIPDEVHGRNALARAAQFASPEEQATIKAKVHAKFPGIKQGSDKLKSFQDRNNEGPGGMA
jgi:hypothetical protein